MVGVHLDANYIFCELIKNQTKGKMIMAYQKMADMKLSALGLKHLPFGQQVFSIIQSMHWEEWDDP